MDKMPETGENDSYGTPTLAPCLELTIFQLAWKIIS